MSPPYVTGAGKGGASAEGPHSGAYWTQPRCPANMPRCHLLVSFQFFPPSPKPSQTKCRSRACELKGRSQETQSSVLRERAHHSAMGPCRRCPPSPWDLPCPGLPLLCLLQHPRARWLAESQGLGSLLPAAVEVPKAAPLRSIAPCSAVFGVKGHLRLYLTCGVYLTPATPRPCQKHCEFPENGN